MVDETVPDPKIPAARMTGAPGPAEPAPHPGDARSPEHAEWLETFNRRMRLPIVLSALIPLLIVPSQSGWVGAVIGVVTWAVFLVDLVVQIRYRVKYLGTGLGKFDLVVVIVTAPWFLIPGLGGARFTVLLRLARLVRVLMVTRGARRLFDRLGRVAAMAFGVMFVGSLVAYHAEHATNPEFANVGDALWWGIVTLTTVGYGDIVPKTSTGRWAAVAIMLTGVATLGVLAGSMASFFRLTPEQEAAEDEEDEEDAAQERRTRGEPEEPPTRPLPTPAVGAAPSTEALAHEVAQLRQQIAELTRLLTPSADDPG